MDDDDELPELDLTIIEDDDDLWLAIDRVISDERFGNLGDRLRDWQGYLRDAVDADAWRVYLEVESLTNERHEEQLMAVAKWAFAQGLKSGQR